MRAGAGWLALCPPTLRCGTIRAWCASASGTIPAQVQGKPMFARLLMLCEREDVSMAPEPAVFNAKIRNRILVRILVAASLVLVGMGLVLYLLSRQLLHAEITAKSEAMV